jgi:site-specific recombinase XerD
MVGMENDTWESYTRSWQRSLRAENKSPRTLETYSLAVDQLGSFLAEHDYPTDPTKVERRHIEAFIGHQLDTKSSATAKQRYQSLRSFFNWLEDEDEIPNPMLKIKPPKVEEKPPPILTTAQMTSVLATASGKSATDRRDAAVLHLLADTGIRASELVGLTLEDVDFDNDVVRVRGKGGKYRAAPFGYTTGQALDRYLRARTHHAYADERTLCSLVSKGRSRAPDWVPL